MPVMSFSFLKFVKDTSGNCVSQRFSFSENGFGSEGIVRNVSTGSSMSIAANSATVTIL